MDEPQPGRAHRDRTLTELMIRYQRGELPAFEELYRLTLPLVRGYMRAFIHDQARVADLVQETFLRLHTSRGTYDPTFPMRPWLLGIARYVRLQDRRALARRLAHGILGPEALKEIVVPPEIDGLAERDALARAMTRLPEDWREAVVFHHIYGMSFREIGHIAGVSEGGARIRASRGMAKLRRLLTAGIAHE
jgi:RNA polymerase sigma-70 factor, ECF subfamily